MTATGVLGAVVRYNDELKEVEVSAITPGATGDNAGLRVGDKMISWKNVTQKSYNHIDSLDTFLQCCKASNPQDSVELEVVTSSGPATLTFLVGNNSEEVYQRRLELPRLEISDLVVPDGTRVELNLSCHGKGLSENKRDSTGYQEVTDHTACWWDAICFVFEDTEQVPTYVTAYLYQKGEDGERVLLGTSDFVLGGLTDGSPVECIAKLIPTSVSEKSSPNSSITTTTACTTVSAKFVPLGFGLDRGAVTKQGTAPQLEAATAPRVGSKTGMTVDPLSIIASTYSSPPSSPSFRVGTQADLDGQAVTPLTGGSTTQQFSSPNGGDLLPKLKAEICDQNIQISKLRQTVQEKENQILRLHKVMIENTNLVEEQRKLQIENEELYSILKQRYEEIERLKTCIVRAVCRKAINARRHKKQKARLTAFLPPEVATALASSSSASDTSNRHKTGRSSVPKSDHKLLMLTKKLYIAEETNKVSTQRIQDLEGTQMVLVKQLKQIKSELDTNTVKSVALDPLLAQLQTSLARAPQSTASASSSDGTGVPQSSSSLVPPSGMVSGERSRSNSTASSSSSSSHSSSHTQSSNSSGSLTPRSRQNLYGVISELKVRLEQMEHQKNAFETQLQKFKSLDKQDTRTPDSSLLPATASSTALSDDVKASLTRSSEPEEHDSVPRSPPQQQQQEDAELKKNIAELEETVKVLTHTNKELEEETAHLKSLQEATSAEYSKADQEEEVTYLRGQLALKRIELEEALGNIQVMEEENRKHKRNPDSITPISPKPLPISSSPTSSGTTLSIIGSDGVQSPGSASQGATVSDKIAALLEQQQQQQQQHVDTSTLEAVQNEELKEQCKTLESEVQQCKATISALEIEKLTWTAIKAAFEDNVVNAQPESLSSALKDPQNNNLLLHVIDSLRQELEICNSYKVLNASAEHEYVPAHANVNDNQQIEVLLKQLEVKDTLIQKLSSGQPLQETEATSQDTLNQRVDELEGLLDERNREIATLRGRRISEYSTSDKSDDAAEAEWEIRYNKLLVEKDTELRQQRLCIEQDMTKRTDQLKEATQRIAKLQQQMNAQPPTTAAATISVLKKRINDLEKVRELHMNEIRMLRDQVKQLSHGNSSIAGSISSHSDTGSPTNSPRRSNEEYDKVFQEKQELKLKLAAQDKTHSLEMDNIKAQLKQKTELSNKWKDQADKAQGVMATVTETAKSSTSKLESRVMELTKDNQSLQNDLATLGSQCEKFEMQISALQQTIQQQKQQYLSTSGTARNSEHINGGAMQTSDTELKTAHSSSLENESDGDDDEVGVLKQEIQLLQQKLHEANHQIRVLQDQAAHIPQSAGMDDTVRIDTTDEEIDHDFGRAEVVMSKPNLMKEGEEIPEMYMAVSSSGGLDQLGRIKELQTEQERLQWELTEQTNECIHLKKRITELGDVEVPLTERYESGEGKTEQDLLIEARLEALGQCLKEEFEEQVKKLESTLLIETELVKEKDSRIFELEQALTSSRAACLSKSQELEVYMKKAEDVTADNIELIQQVGDTAILQDELEQKKVELSEYIGKYRELDARCSALKAANKEKRTRVQQMQQDRKKMDLLAATNKHLKLENQKIQTQLEDKKNTTRQTQQKLESVQNQLFSTKSALTSLEVDNSVFRDDVKKKQAEIDSLQPRLLDALDELSNAHHTIGQLEEKTTDIMRRTTDCVELELQLSSINDELEEKNEQQQRWQQRVVDLERVVFEQKGTIKQLNNELEEAHTSLDFWQQQVNSHQQESTAQHHRTHHDDEQQEHQQQPQLTATTADRPFGSQTSPHAHTPSSGSNSTRSTPTPTHQQPQQHPTNWGGSASSTPRSTPTPTQQQMTNNGSSTFITASPVGSLQHPTNSGNSSRGGGGGGGVGGGVVVCTTPVPMSSVPVAAPAVIPPHTHSLTSSHAHSFTLPPHTHSLTPPPHTHSLTPTPPPTCSTPPPAPAATVPVPIPNSNPTTTPTPAAAPTTSYHVHSHLSTRRSTTTSSTTPTTTSVDDLEEKLRKVEMNNEELINAIDRRLSGAVLAPPTPTPPIPPLHNTTSSTMDKDRRAKQKMPTTTIYPNQQHWVTLPHPPSPVHGGQPATATSNTSGLSPALIAAGQSSVAVTVYGSQPEDMLMTTTTTIGAAVQRNTIQPVYETVPPPSRATPTSGAVVAHGSGGSSMLLDNLGELHSQLHQLHHQMCPEERTKPQLLTSGAPYRFQSLANRSPSNAEIGSSPTTINTLDSPLRHLPLQ